MHGNRDMLVIGLEPSLDRRTKRRRPVQLPTFPLARSFRVAFSGRTVIGPSPKFLGNRKVTFSPLLVFDNTSFPLISFTRAVQTARPIPQFHGALRILLEALPERECLCRCLLQCP